MRKLLLLVVCVFFTLTTFAQVQQPIWKKNMEQPVPYFDGGDRNGIRVKVEGIYEVELENSDFNRFGADLIIGNQAGSDFFIGGGVGMRLYDELEITVIPIFLNVRRTFMEGNQLRPYVEIKGGYGLEADGIFFEPSLGFMLGDVFYIGGGVSIQKFKEYETNSSAGMFKIGLKI